MDQRAVVALVIVLGHHLPIRSHLVSVPVAEHEIFRRVRSDHLCEAPDVLLESDPLGAQGSRRVAEHPALPQPYAELDQTVLRRLEVCRVTRAVRGQHGAGQVVGPGVVRAHHRQTLAAGPVRHSSWPRCEQVLAKACSRSSGQVSGTSPAITARCRAGAAARAQVALATQAGPAARAQLPARPSGSPP